MCKPVPPSSPSDRLRWMRWSASPRFPTCLTLQRRLWRFRLAQRKIAERGFDQLHPLSDRSSPLASSR